MNAAEKQQILREIFAYDPSEPLALRWKKTKRYSRARVGEIAGYWHTCRAKNPRLYRFVDVPWKKRMPTHHAVWIYSTGTEPPEHLKFKDGNLGDCRIENLEKYEIIHTKSGERFEKFKDKFSDEEWQAYIRRRNLKRDYGITPEERAHMLEAQGCVCAICGNPETLFRRGKTAALSIDHCHETKKVRGLLCGSCNNGLGRFAHDTDRLRRAAEYLENALAATHNALAQRGFTLPIV